SFSPIRRFNPILTDSRRSTDGREHEILACRGPAIKRDASWPSFTRHGCIGCGRITGKLKEDVNVRHGGTVIAANPEKTKQKTANTLSQRGNNKSGPQREPSCYKTVDEADRTRGTTHHCGRRRRCRPGPRHPARPNVGSARSSPGQTD